MAENRVPAVVPKRHKLTFRGVLRSEWIKVFSLRSTKWLMAMAVLVSTAAALGYSALHWYMESRRNLGEPIGIPEGAPIAMVPGEYGLLSSIVAQACTIAGTLLFSLLCVLIYTNEHSSGMIKATYVVAPRRGRVVIAKIFIILLLCVLLFGISLAASWGGSYLILQGGIGVDFTLLSPVSLRILGGALINIALVGMFSFGVGAMFRSSAVAIAIVVTAILIIPGIGLLLREIMSLGLYAPSWEQWAAVAQWFLPSRAGALVMLENQPTSAPFGPWIGVGVLGAWTILTLFLGMIVVKRRDA